MIIMKSKIVHIMHNDKFNSEYINFINQNFNPNDHLFIFVADVVGELFPIPQLPNVIKLFCRRRRFYRYLLLAYYCIQADKIILHGLFVDYIIRFLYINRYLLKKCYWVIWGGDLHQLIERHKENMPKLVLSNIPNLITLTKGDGTLFIQQFKTNPNVFDGIYINPIKTDMLHDTNNKNDDIHILIGNSATESNFHIEVFEWLKTYRNYNIRLIVPLSYGDDAYKTKILSVGFEIFDKKLHPITDFMSPQEYAKLLSSIDIAIFNNTRQQALGNIFALLYANKKLFIRQESPTWDVLNNSLKFKVFNTSSIVNLNFEQFIDTSLLNDKNNKCLAYEYFYSPAHIKNIWQNIFNS